MSREKKIKKKIKNCQSDKNTRNSNYPHACRLCICEKISKVELGVSFGIRRHVVMQKNGIGAEGDSLHRELRPAIVA